MRVKPCPSFPGYSASDTGKVFSARAKPVGLEMKPALDVYGYQRVKVWRGSRQVSTFVHALVLDAFVGPRPSGKHQVRHLDGNKLNNNLSNLCWGTHAENTADRMAHGRQRRGETQVLAKLTDAKVRELREREAAGETHKELAKRFGISRALVSYVARGLRWAHIGRSGK